MDDQPSAAATAAPCNLDTQWLGYWGEKPAGVACGQPSAATVTLACPHEHIDTVTHLPRLRRSHAASIRADHLQAMLGQPPQPRLLLGLRRADGHTGGSGSPRLADTVTSELQVLTGFGVQWKSGPEAAATPVTQGKR